MRFQNIAVPPTLAELFYKCLDTCIHRYTICTPHTMSNHFAPDSGLNGSRINERAGPGRFLIHIHRVVSSHRRLLLPALSAEVS